MEIFLVSRGALPVFLNEGNWRKLRQKTRLNREKKTNERVLL